MVIIIQIIIDKNTKTIFSLLFLSMCYVLRCLLDFFCIFAYSTIEDMRAFFSIRMIMSYVIPDNKVFFPYTPCMDTHIVETRVVAIAKKRLSFFFLRFLLNSK
jgi:hypothetical protein